MAEELNRPKAMIWLESSLTTSHFVITPLLSKKLQEQGFDVIVVTSEDSKNVFENAGGKFDAYGMCQAESTIDFGRNCKFITSLPLQTSYANMQTHATDSDIGPFEFTGSAENAESRKKFIEKALDFEKLAAIFTELWPTAYGPVSGELTDMANYVREKLPDAKIYSFAREIPFIDTNHNNAQNIAHLLGKVNKILANGDGGIKLEQFVSVDHTTKDKIVYTGYYVSEMPERTDIPDFERKVLVSSGSGWNSSVYMPFYEGVIKSIPYTTDVKSRPWEIIVSDACQQEDFAKLERQVEESCYNGISIELRRNYKNPEFKQQIADCAISISFLGSSTMFEAIHARVLGVLYVGTAYAPIVNEGEERSGYLNKIGAAVQLLPTADIESPEKTALMINASFAKRSTTTQVNFHGPINAALEATKDLVLTQGPKNYQEPLYNLYKHLAQSSPEEADNAVSSLLAQRYAIDAKKYGNEYAYEMLADFHSNTYLAVLMRLSAEDREDLLPAKSDNGSLHGRICANVAEHIYTNPDISASFKTIAGETSGEYVKKLRDLFAPTYDLAKYFTPADPRGGFMESRRSYNRDRFEVGENKAIELLIEKVGLTQAYGAISVVHSASEAYYKMRNFLNLPHNVKGQKELDKAVKLISDISAGKIEHSHVNATSSTVNNNKHLIR